MMHYVLLFAFILFVSFPSAADSGGLTPNTLRVEYRRNPMNIGVRAPRFMWRVVSGQRNQMQHAYQLLVSDAPEPLAANTGNMWDTGKIQSDKTAYIVYEGAPLRPGTPYYWKVRVWDQDDAVSDWSAPAHFATALLFDDSVASGEAFLDRFGKHAAVIGFDAGHKAMSPMDSGPSDGISRYPDMSGVDYAAAGAPSIEEAQWIWHPEGNPLENAPEGARYFRRILTLPEDARIVNAQMLIAADDGARIWINGRQVGVGYPEMRYWRRVFHFLVASLLIPGDNIIAARAENGTGPAGLVAALRVSLSDGRVIDCLTDSAWKSGDKVIGNTWKTAAFDDDSWPEALELTAFGNAPWQESKIPYACFEPVPHLRTEFDTRKDISRATVYATAWGLYSLRVNGARVGDHYFTPGWTDYHKRLYYHSYDVTSMLRPGEKNAFGALLANGWYAGHVSLRMPGLYGARPRLWALMRIEYADGTEEYVGTNASWRAAFGEIRGAELLMGEIRDQQQALTGWDLPAYDDSAWKPVTVGALEVMPQRIEAYPGAPVKAFEELPAKSVAEPQPGVYVYDLGQNMVGWARITLDGRPGQMVRVRHTEMLTEEGMLYTEALRSALATNVYRIASTGVQTLAPEFTFHGFRYVELRGLDAPLPPEAVVGVVLHADVPIAADFECSEPLLNQLVHNIHWGLKGNYLELPTDCPQRDERLGWTGDAQFFMPTALYTADIGAFFTKWLIDLIQDSQLEDGSFAHVAPDVELGGGAVAWGDAAMICPWLFYQFYGDKRVIERHFDNMARGMTFLEETSENFMRKRLGFGDWLNLGGSAKDEVICTAYYAYLADIMAQMASLIGRDAEARHFADLHRNIRNAFVENFIDNEGRILESSQTGYALAFAFDLIPEALREAAAARYVEEIERFDWHLATGFIGTPRLLPTLTQAGRDDVAWRLLMNTTYPSWLFQVTLGATTMWERWNGWTPDEGFGDPRMNSFNHYAFGAVGEWIYGRVAGISPEEPGFRRVRIAPMPGGGLTHARLTYDSIRGPIRSEWRIEDGIFILEVEVPANAEATVVIPTGDPTSVKESGKSLEEAEISILSQNPTGVSCAVGSGRYLFQAETL